MHSVLTLTTNPKAWIAMGLQIFRGPGPRQLLIDGVVVVMNGLGLLSAHCLGV